MAKLEFAKIFDLEKHQVLITKDYDVDDGIFKINQRTEFEDCTPQVAFGFKSENEANECFQKYDSKQAQNFLTSMLYILDFGDDYEDN